MPQQKHTRTTDIVGWADTVNNNAVWDNAWDLNERAEFAVSDLDLAYKTGNNGLVIEEIIFIGTGTPPSKADKDEIQIMIAKDAGFTDIIHLDKGYYSDAKYDTTKCIASFHIGHPIVVQETDILYCTVKCEGSSVTLTATSARITASQS